MSDPSHEEVYNAFIMKTEVFFCKTYGNRLTGNILIIFYTKNLHSCFANFVCFVS